MLRLRHLRTVFGVDAVALGDGAAGLGEARDLGPGGRRSAGVPVNVQHGSLLS